MNVYRIYFSNGLSAFIRADSLTDALKVCVADMVTSWEIADPLCRPLNLRGKLNSLVTRVVVWAKTIRIA